MTTADWITGILAIAAILIAAVAAFFARKQANAAHSQVEVAKEALRASEIQAEAYAGAQSATMWRDQVLAMHERGLRPDQIRFIFHLEHGGAGYEGWNGAIDDIVRGLPQPELVMEGNVAPGSCPVMPRTMDGCTGDCQAALERSGCADYRRGAS